MEHKSLLEEFCVLTKIKKCIGYLYNKDTHEIRYYTNKKSLYKLPKGWKNVERFCNNTLIYPNIFSPENFFMILDVQWQLFGQLGQQYKRVKNEPFEINYIQSKVDMIKMCKSMGGAPALTIYIELISKLPFVYYFDEKLENEINIPN